MRRGIVLVVCCLGLVACGGSSATSSTTPASTRPIRTHPPPSPAEVAFAAHLSSICRKANAAYNAAHNSKGQVAAIQRYLVVFRGVKAPARLQSIYSRYVAVLAAELAALKGGDSKKLIEIRDTKAGPLVRQLRATGCYS